MNERGQALLNLDIALAPHKGKEIAKLKKQDRKERVLESLNKELENSN